MTQLGAGGARALPLRRPHENHRQKESSDNLQHGERECGIRNIHRRSPPPDPGENPSPGSDVVRCLEDHDGQDLEIHQDQSPDHHEEPAVARTGVPELNTFFLYQNRSPPKTFQATFRIRSRETICNGFSSGSWTNYRPPGNPAAHTAGWPVC